MTQTFDDAVQAFIWRDGAAIPGRHPDRVTDDGMRARVIALVRQLDAIQPGADAADLMPWADRKARELAASDPELGDQAIRALRDLLSWAWR